MKRIDGYKRIAALAAAAALLAAQQTGYQFVEPWNTLLLAVFIFSGGAGVVDGLKKAKVTK